MLGRSIGYSACRVLSPVRLRLGPPSLFFRTGSPKDRSSCRIPTRSLAHGRGIFAVGTLSLRFTALSSWGAPSVYPACNELPESMCPSTAPTPTPTTSTAAPTRMMICSGGPIASRNGKVRGDLCSSTSTTTELEMQFAMLLSLKTFVENGTS